MADRDEIINEDLQDLNANMQTKVKEQLAKNNDVYIIVAQFEEECVQMRYVRALTAVNSVELAALFKYINFASIGTRRTSRK